MTCWLLDLDIEHEYVCQLSGKLLNIRIWISVYRRRDESILVNSFSFISKGKNNCLCSVDGYFENGLKSSG